MKHRAVLVSVVLLASMVAAAEDDRSTKQSLPSTGSYIRKNAAEANVSLKRRYAELSEAEREGLREQYGLAAGDEPPYPRDGILRITQEIVSIRDSHYISGEITAF